MSTKTDELLINVSLNAKQMTKSIQNAEKQMQQFAHNITTIIGTALDILALKFSVTFGKTLVEAFANGGAKLGYFSQQVGENAGKMDQWSTAVRKAGGTADGFFNTINGLHNKLVDMKIGGDMKTAGVFGLLGINTHNAQNELKKPTEILLELSDKLKGQSKDFQQYIGRQLGIDDATLRILSEGKDATLKLVNAQQQLWDDKKIAAAQRMQNKLIDLDRKLDGLKITIAEKLLPYADKFINWIQEFVDKHGKDMANIIEAIVKALMDLIKYLPDMIEKIIKFNKDMGITVETLGKVLTALVALKVVKDVFGIITMGATAATAAVNAMLGPLGAIIAAISTIKWVYDKYEEFKKDPNAFNTEDRSLTNVKGKIGRLFQMGEKIGGGVYDAVQWAQGMVESGNKDDTIGYKMKKDKNGKYQNVLDANGNKIPEAYGRYQIMPSTASEVMGRQVTGNELLNGKFNEEVHGKLMEKWTKQFGSHEAALAYYNAGKHGVNTYNKTGTTEYLSKIKSMLGLGSTDSLNNYMPNPNTVGPQSAAKIPSSPIATGNNAPVIHIQNMDVKADNVNDLLDSVQSKINPAFAFNNNPRIA